MCEANFYNTESLGVMESYLDSIMVCCNLYNIAKKEKELQNKITQLLKFV